MSRTRNDQPLLGEWACLGLVYPNPTHGFAIAARLKPSGDVGRVWSLSRPLTYRAIDQLTARGYIHAIGEEPGIAGGNRTILAATRSGRAQFRTWVRTPVSHLRDLRSELLLKLVLSDICDIETTQLLDGQRQRIDELASALRPPRARGTDEVDVVALWRHESSQAAVRFLETLRALRTHT